MKKVAYMLGSLNRGGTESLLLDLFLKKEAIPFEFIGVYRKSGDLEKEFSATNVPFYKLAPKNKFDFSYVFKLRKLLQKNEINVVHAQQPLDLCYAFYASRKLNIKLVLSFHGFDFNDTYLAKKVLSFAIFKSDKNIYVSEYLKNYYSQKFNLDAQKQMCVYNGVSGSDFSQRISKSQIKNEIKLQENELLFASVGNFVAVRNQLFICHFLKTLAEKQIAFKFLFIGKKDEKNPHFYDDCFTFCEENNLKEKVLFLGSRSDVKGILPELDAFIYTSQHDTFGLALVEAIFAGIPVFVNDWEVMKEITNQGTLANVYKTDDLIDLEDKFNLFLANIVSYKEHAKNKAMLAQKKYSIENHIEALDTLYSNLFY